MFNQFYYYLLKLNEYDRKIKLNDSLAVSLNDFQERWNQYAVEFHFTYSDLEISTNDSILNVELIGNNNISFLGDIIEYNDEKILKSINMIASGDGSPESGANIFIAIGILVACLNPQEGVDFRKNILAGLELFDIKVGMKNSIVVNSFRYTVNFNKELGLRFSVQRN